MKHYKYSDQMELGDSPPEGDDAWLWFKPLEPPIKEMWLSDMSGYCAHCDVTHRIPFSSGARPKCWCCGRFTKWPRAYDYKSAYARMHPRSVPSHGGYSE